MSRSSEHVCKCMAASVEKKMKAKVAVSEEVTTTTTIPATRFDLENQIGKAWDTVDDLTLIAESLDNEEMRALALLHELRCKKLFNTFEELVCSGKLT